MQTNITNELLFHDMKEGDAYAFEILFHRYYKKLCRYCYSIVKKWEIAEEISVDILHRLWSNKERIIITTGIDQYLFRSAHNGALNYIRDASRREIDVTYVSDFADDLPETERAFIHVMEGVKETSIYERFDAMIARLPVTNQQVMALRKEGVTHKEIAGRMNLSEKKVRNMTERTIQKLREQFKNARFNESLPDA